MEGSSFKNRYVVVVVTQKVTRSDRVANKLGSSQPCWMDMDMDMEWSGKWG